MAFLSSLTDAFTGAPAKEAAATTRNYLGGVQSQGNADIGTGVLNARSAVGAGLDASRGALGTGYTTATGDVNAGATDALGYLDKGYGDAGTYYDAARGAYAPLSDLGKKYGGATTLALNSLGVNGAAGTAAARDAFKAGPAYEFNLDQGLESINRARNRAGMLGSGNTDRAAQEYGAGLASNEYDKWLNNLLGFTNPELSATSGAASGIAGVNTTQAGAASELGQNKAGISTGRAAMLADLASKYGRDSANLETGAGQTLANIETGGAGQRVDLARGVAQPYANTYGQEAAAEQGGSANLWNLLLNAGKLATGQAGSRAGSANANAGGISKLIPVG